MTRTQFLAPVLLGLFFVGCGQDDRDYVEEFDAELAAMTGIESAEESGDSSVTATSSVASNVAGLTNTESAANPFAASAAAENSSPAMSGQIALQVGKEYSFTRTLRQSLLQQIRGAQQRSESTLEVSFQLRVDAVQPQQTTLSVQFTDVKYYHEIAGQKISFDRSTPATQIPTDALPYRGLLDNGFSFSLGANNQVGSLLGFDQFLQRCVRYLPAEQQADVVQSMAAGSPAEAVARFVDESFGLLPKDASGTSRVNVGDSWQHDRQLGGAVPMYLSSTCSLKSVMQGTAHVELAGRVSGSNQRQSGLKHGTNLNVRSGRTTGSCQIDQQTGLPINGRIERSLQLDVAMSDGTNGRQQKDIVSSIKMTTGANTAAVSAPQNAPNSTNTPSAIYGN